MLVVVEDGDVEQVLEAPFDLEAARGRDILEVDASEARGNQLDGPHDFVGVLRVEADRPGVDAGELLEQHRLALHHGQRRAGTDVAETENGRAVGDDGDGVALAGQVPDAVRVVGDGAGDPRHPRRVRHRKVVARADRHLRGHLDLAALVHQERAIRDAEDADAVDRADRLDDALAVLLVGAQNADVANDRVLVDAHEIDRTEDRIGLADRRRDAGELPRLMGDQRPNREAVGGGVVRRHLPQGSAHGGTARLHAW